MMDWTDRHCRYFHRLLSRRALLYTEMVTSGALLHGDVPRHLRFHDVEHPVALQLGGSEPADLAHCACLGEEWGYDEVNLNCGCPSERVQRGAFGACLMNEPQLVADCVKAMVDATSLPVTVKHRIGIDKIERYEFVRDVVGTVSEAGCNTFIVHARNAWLKGLSPKQNREVPPLRYELVHRLKHELAHLRISINGGFADNAAVHQQLRLLDGVMVGAGTALCDDPQLTVRHVEGPDPRRIVLSGRGRVLRRGAGLRVFTPPGCDVVVIDTIEDPLHDPMARLIRVRSKNGSIEPCAILGALRDRGIHSVYLEGGSTAVSSFLQARCIDLLQVHIAAMVMGSGLPSFVLPAVDHVQDSIKFAMSHAMLDGHVLLSCWPSRTAPRTAAV